MVAVALTCPEEWFRQVVQGWVIIRLLVRILREAKERDS